jgi:predicted nucleic acid-binding protein
VIVLDSSYTLALVMPDESRPPSMAKVMFDRLAAPSIWPIEIANAMRNGVRRGRVRADEVVGLCADIAEFDVEVVPAAHHDPQRYFEAAQAHDLTPYDAMYLELALQRRYALATRDEALALAARRVGVEVYS